MQALLLPLLLAGAAAPQELPIPPLTGPVIDTAGLLGPGEAERIAAGLRAYQSQSTNQLQVLIIPSLPEGVPIEEYSIRVVERWKLGTAEQDNGVLLLIAAKDREWRIEVGGGLEGELTDLQASRIGREILVPAFRRGDYATGVAGALQGIAGALGGKIEFQGLPKTVPRPRGRSVGGLLPLILFALLILFAGRGRRGLFGAMILGSMFGRGYRGGGGGGGGWGGGGGGFSGGGAGGDW